MNYYINTVACLMFLSFGLLAGYYFADSSWRHRKRAEWREIQAGMRALQHQNERLKEINDVLVEKMKELVPNEKLRR